MRSNAEPDLNAGSASPYLSRLRTTMGVENFWRQLKHGFLHNLLRPHLNQLVWILVTKVTPAYLARAEILNDGHRLGRSQAPTHFQKQFKSAWLQLEKLTLSTDADRKYITRVDRWTCTCPSQPLNCCHLCKHLVGAVGHPPPRLWTEVVHRRKLPLYRHPALVVRGEENLEYINPADGSITDGDDHAWSADPNFLTGGGGWRTLDFSTTSFLGKGARIEPDGDSSSQENVDEIQRQFFPAFETHDSDGETEPDDYSERLLKRAADLEKAAAIIRAQVPHRNKLWMSSVVKRDIGGNVSQFVADINRFERTSRAWDSTWAKAGDNEGQCRMQNTMGCQVPLTSALPKFPPRLNWC
ncbi:hypothetical protein C8R45DRAFT_1171983 [Mycena sanguinolenta]|nr:hypothetical protein C8R45DRAFT_1171983 [Mycena sanguinolenta]